MSHCGLGYRLAVYNNGMYDKENLYDRFFKEKKRGLGKHVDSLNAPAPRATIGVRRRDDNTRTPNVRGSGGRRFCPALPAGVAEGRATGTDRSLRHKAVVRSGPYAGATAGTPRQRTIGLGPDRTCVTTSLLHARRQRPVVTTPLGAGVAVIGIVFRRKTTGSLRAPNWQCAHPVPLPHPGVGGDHHEVAHSLQPRPLLVTLGQETDGLARRRWVATVTCRCGREVGNWRNIDHLYHRLASVRHTTGKNDIANGRQIVRRKIAAIPTAGPPPQGIAQQAHETSNGRTTVRRTPNGKEKKSRTYGEKRHGDDCEDGLGDGCDNRNGGGDGVANL